MLNSQAISKNGEVSKLEKILKIICILSVATLVFNILINVLLSLSGTAITNIRYNTFSDFGEVMYYCFDPQRYSRGVIYPPISFLIFLPLAIFIKKPIKNFLATDMTSAELYKFSASAPVIIMLVIYFLINTAITLFLIFKIIDKKGFSKNSKIYIMISSACFGPCIFAFFRGNIILTLLPLVLAFFYLYNSEKRWQRELANVCLALAMSIKIYPIFMLVFFIKDRRFLDMLKTFVYALAFLFIPFLFIKGGFNNVPIMWNNCFGFKGKKAVEVRRNNISIASLFNQIAFDFNSLTGVSIYGFTNILTKIFKFTLLIGTIVVFAFAKKSELKMQISLLTILAYIIFQDGSYGYVMIYILIPILFYLIDFDKISKFDKYFYGICFIIITLPIFYTFNFLTYHAVILFALAIKCFVDIIKDIIKIHKETKAKVENTQSGEQTEVKIDAEKVENSPSQETTTENASNLKNDEDLNSEKIAQTKTAKASNLKKKSTKTL